MSFAFSSPTGAKYASKKIRGKPKKCARSVSSFCWQKDLLVGSFWREPGSPEFRSWVEDCGSSSSQKHPTAMVGGLQCCLSLRNTFFCLLCLSPVFSLLWISGISALSKARMGICLEGCRDICSYWKNKIQLVIILMFIGKETPAKFLLSKTVAWRCVMGNMVTRVYKRDQCLVVAWLSCGGQ